MEHWEDGEWFAPSGEVNEALVHDAEAAQSTDETAISAGQDVAASDADTLQWESDEQAREGGKREADEFAEEADEMEEDEDTAIFSYPDTSSWFTPSPFDALSTAAADAETDADPLVDPFDAYAHSTGTGRPPSTSQPRMARRSEPRPRAMQEDPYALPYSTPYSSFSPIDSSPMDGGASSIVGDAVQDFSNPPPGVRGRRGTPPPLANDHRPQEWRSRRTALLLALVSAALIFGCLILLLTPNYQRAGFPFSVGRYIEQHIFSAPSATSGAPGATPTIGSTNAPTHSPSGSGATPTPPVGATPTPPGPTPTPLPTGATVSFFVSTQQLSPPGGMTACSSGCDLPGAGYAHSDRFSMNNFQSTQIPQTQLLGSVQVTNTGSTTWSVSSFDFGGGGYTCAPIYNITLPGGTSHNYECVINAQSPQEIGAGVISGSVPGTRVRYTNPNPLYGNGGYQVTNQDCQNAYATVVQQDGIPTENAWLHSQLPAGWQYSLSAPQYATSNEGCPLGQNIQFFSVTLTESISDGGYNPGPAPGLALSRLQGSVPNGYILLTHTTCTPEATGYSNGVTDVQCTDSGTAAYTWTAALKAQLATSLEGLSHQAATTTCNQTAGVGAQSCVITIQNSDTMPTSLSNITIDANIP